MTNNLRLDLFVVTSSGLVPGRGHREVALAAVEGGAAAVQLRAPELADEDLLPLAAELARICRTRGVLFVVNNRIEVAVASGAGGAHVGQSDGPETARARLGPDLVLGVSVGSPEQARAAEAMGADYLGATMWATPTKPEAEPLGPERFAEIVAATSLPVVGIGGITATNARRVMAAGAAGVAVISAVGAAADPVAATRTLVQVVRQPDPPMR